MEVVWYGAGCFRIVERGYPSVITDPFTEDNPNITLPKLQSEIVTSSRIIDEPFRAEWQGVPGVIHTIAGPGEYEIGGVFITGVDSHRSADPSKNTPDNVVYAFDYGGLIICHFGECGSVPTQAQIEKIGHINVLIIPVGIEDGLSPAKASEIVSMIEPDIVVPMHYGLPGGRTELKLVTPFLKLMGVENPVASQSLKIESPVFPEGTQVVLLEQV